MDEHACIRRRLSSPNRFPSSNLHALQTSLQTVPLYQGVLTMSQSPLSGAPIRTGQRRDPLRTRGRVGARGAIRWRGEDRDHGRDPARAVRIEQELPVGFEPRRAAGVVERVDGENVPAVILSAWRYASKPVTYAAPPKKAAMMTNISNAPRIGSRFRSFQRGQEPARNGYVPRRTFCGRITQAAAITMQPAKYAPRLVLPRSSRAAPNSSIT